jgi:hypothetical protein
MGVAVLAPVVVTPYLRERGSRRVLGLHERVFTGDDKIVAMYSGGMSVREI